MRNYKPPFQKQSVASKFAFHQLLDRHPKIRGNSMGYSVVFKSRMVLALALSLVASLAYASSPDYSPGEVIVKFKSGQAGLMRTRAETNMLYEAAGVRSV